ncbi:hypothetical protein [Paenibacillus turpanensis]|uniref:hypothetical protein n=1 Tax=Paenibacillus turpanensis TaxID=2689078 RepID=UPI00140A70BA|nr:hypothetical protein [Paenibacillus turpanensis]
MKKTRYYPFERNRYFYGKLLTVRDFESEQNYFNNKRRMMNRLLHGVGVITGLQVIAVDDKNISVEMGAAMDALGREIIVPSPVMYKLSMMEGFTNNEYAKNVYLCLAYDEKGKEPVHSVANATVRVDEISEYNRTLESYRLFIREEAPVTESLPMASLMEQTVVLYQENGVRVLQVTPKYVNPGQVFEIVIRIEKTLRAGKIRFQFEPAVEGVELLNGPAATFDEPREGQETEYELIIQARAIKVEAAKATIRVREGTFSMSIGDRNVTLGPAETGAIEIMEGSVEERWMKDYLSRSLDSSLDSTSDPYINLAKISLLQMGPTYIIDKVEQVPFGEYVYNASVLYQLERAAAHRNIMKQSKLQAPQEESVTGFSEISLRHKPTDDTELRPATRALPVEIKNIPEMMKSGSIEIPITPFPSFPVPFGKTTRSFISTEIEHGLGEGSVWVFTALEESGEDALSDMLDTRERMYFGEADVFKGTEYETDLPELKIGSIVYPLKGTFRIGIRLLQATEATKVRIRWWACRTDQGQATKEALEEALAMLSEAASGSDEI